MRTFIFLLTLLLFCSGCIKRVSDKKPGGGNQASLKYSFQEIECKKYDESFDSTFVVNGNKVRLVCNTECFNDCTIADTINDSIINLYPDRFLKFELKSNTIDTQFVVTKQIIKNIYHDNSTYRSSVLAFPRIEKINSAGNSVLIHTMFLCPGSFDATNFLEEIVLEITAEAKVSVHKIILPPEEPDSLNTVRLP